MKTNIGKLMILVGIVTYISINGCTGGWWESRYRSDLYEELELYNVKTIAVLPLQAARIKAVSPSLFLPFASRAKK